MTKFIEWLKVRLMKYKYFKFEVIEHDVTTFINKYQPVINVFSRRSTPTGESESGFARGPFRAVPTPEHHHPPPGNLTLLVTT